MDVSLLRTGLNLPDFVIALETPIASRVTEVMFITSDPSGMISKIFFLADSPFTTTTASLPFTFKEDTAFSIPDSLASWLHLLFQSLKLKRKGSFSLFQFFDSF